jgi:hypothetical protein
MLAQDRAHLAAVAESERVGLYIKEIDYMRTELSTMATVCTFLAGALFAQTLVSEDSSACKAKWGLALLSYCDGLSGLIGCMLVVSLATNLLALVSAVLVQIFGSMAVLKAEPKNLTKIFYKLRRKRRMVIRLFLLGIGCFSITTMLDVFRRFNETASIVSMIVFTIANVYMLRVFRGVKKSFGMPSMMPSVLGKMLGSAKYKEERAADEEQYILMRDETSNMWSSAQPWHEHPSGLLCGSRNRNRHASERRTMLSSEGEEATCQHCQTTITAASNFCHRCGALSGQRCCRCHCQLKANSVFCPACGEPSKDDEEDADGYDLQASSGATEGSSGSGSGASDTTMSSGVAEPVHSEVVLVVNEHERGGGEIETTNGEDFHTDTRLPSPTLCERGGGAAVLMSSWLKEKAVLNWKSSFYVLLEASNGTSVNGTSTAVLQKFADPGGQILAEHAVSSMLNSSGTNFKIG